MKSKTSLLILAVGLAAYSAGMYFPLPAIKAAENLRYVQHRPPENSVFGRHEEEKGPYVLKNTQMGETVIVEDQSWKIDSSKGSPQYVSTANAYTHIKMDDGTYKDIAITVIEEEDYLPGQSRKIPEKRLPVSDTDKLPDSLYYSSLKQLGIFGAPLWERIRTAALPFVFESNGKEYTVTDRRFEVNAVTNAYTTLATGLVRKVNSKEAASPLRLKEERFITQ